MFCRLVLTALASLTVAIPCSADTVIDFETPVLRSEPYQFISPYVAEGVTFSGGVMGLVKESVLTSCVHNPHNQLLGTAPSLECPVGSGDSWIGVAFPPDSAGPANMVSMEIQTPPQRFGCAGVLLYNSSDELIAFGFGTPPVPAYGNCTGSTGLSYRCTVTASARERVAYAYVIPPSVICTPGRGCDVACIPFVIDNLTIGFEQVIDPPLLAITPFLLSPPNHGMVTVRAAATAQGECQEPQLVTLVSITSDEPDAGTGDEDLPNDVQSADLGTADFEFALRAERAEEGDGRTYAVCYEVRCAGGDIRQECAFVDVPHDRRASALSPQYGDGDGDGREDVTSR